MPLYPSHYSSQYPAPQITLYPMGNSLFAAEPHKVLKSGFKAEEVRLRAAERIVNMLAILCILSWRVFWVTMMNRTIPDATPELVFTPTEIYLLDQLVSDNARVAPVGNSLSVYLTKLARLGGYLARARDPPPGNIVIWRGLSRLTAIQPGSLLCAHLAGNYKHHRPLPS